ncbi:hypothetical protein ACP70R_006690 [Stipagrostis hirtigluma subsp. patula]
MRPVSRNPAQSNVQGPNPTGESTERASKPLPPWRRRTRREQHQNQAPPRAAAPSGSNVSVPFNAAPSVRPISGGLVAVPSGGLDLRTDPLRGPPATCCGAPEAAICRPRRDRASGRPVLGAVCQRTDPQTTKSTVNFDQTNINGGVKRKHDHGCSPTLVEKVKTRADRQPSKVRLSLYQCIKPKRLFEIPTDGAHLAKQLAVNTEKVLVSIGESELRDSILRPLIRPTRENGTQKWLNAQIINSYRTIFNSNWEKQPDEMKHAIPVYYSDWLQRIGKYSINLVHLKKELVILPVNYARNSLGLICNNSHWWLCVLNARKEIFQILDSLHRHRNYKEETKELVLMWNIYNKEHTTLEWNGTHSGILIGLHGDKSKEDAGQTFIVSIK